MRCRLLSRAMTDATLPDWPAGTVCVLATSGAGGPHAIPVSTALRAGDDRIVLALARTRGSLERLRADPRVALTVMAAADLGFTAHGTARVVADPLPGVEGVTGVEIRVQAVHRHERPTFAIEAGVAWRWTDAAAQARDDVVRAALLDLPHP